MQMSWLRDGQDDCGLYSFSSVDEKLDRLANAVTQESLSLQYLSILECRDLTDAGMNSIARMPSIKRLSLTRVSGSPADLSPLLGLGGIERIEIVDTPTRNVDALLTLPNLRSLLLFREHVPWEQDEQRAWLKVLPQLEHLESIEIGGSIDDQALRDLQDKLPTMKVIEVCPY